MSVHPNDDYANGRDFDEPAIDPRADDDNPGLLDYDLASIRRYGHAGDVDADGRISVADCLVIEAERLRIRGDRVATWLSRKLLDLANDARVFGTRI